MADNKHLNLSHRITIEHSLANHFHLNQLEEISGRIAPPFPRRLESIGNSRKLVLMAKLSTTVFTDLHVLYPVAVIILHVGITSEILRSLPQSLCQIQEGKLYASH